MDFAIPFVRGAHASILSFGIYLVAVLFTLAIWFLFALFLLDIVDASVLVDSAGRGARVVVCKCETHV